ncbi:MAG TPA: type VI secretion system tube protein Hcp [Polyangia bacterium]|jgi:type VI secretion system secreted protein Hcp|nr:type VI secretion system tube protein Hcp [Polyangia bacterium]
MAVDMFMKIDDVEGETSSKEFPKNIDVISWNWGMTQSGSAQTGTGAGSGKVNVHDLTFTKYIDSSTHNLMKMCCNGKHFKLATLTVRKAGGTPLPYLVIKLHDGLISGVHTGGNGGDDRFTENVTLNFAKFEVSYTPQGAGAIPGGTKDTAWNIAANSDKLG